MQRLLDRLVGRLLVEREQRPDAGCRGRADMRDVVDLVLVQADAFDQVDVDLVGRGDRTHEIVSVAPALLGHGEGWRNVVAGMRIVGGQERVVKIQFADRGAVGPGRPFGAHRCCLGRAEQGRATRTWMRQCHRARGLDRSAIE